MEHVLAPAPIAPLRHRQLLADFWVADPAILQHAEPLWTELLAAIPESGATILTAHVHQFQPSGFTGFVLLAQSHVSVHSWVEQRLLLLDVQSCGPMRPEVIVERLRAFVLPCAVDVRHVERGASR